jgi:hypothetical protein
MQPGEDGLRAVRAPDLDREMLHPAIVGPVDVQPPGLRGLHRQARGGDGHQVVMRREVLGGGIGGEAGEPVGHRRRVAASPISTARTQGRSCADFASRSARR